MLQRKKKYRAVNFTPCDFGTNPFVFLKKKRPFLSREKGKRGLYIEKSEFIKLIYTEKA